MKALFIGGTGTISTAVSALAAASGWELTLLNRGSRCDKAPQGAKVLTCDIHDEAAVARLTEGMQFDVVADFIAFKPAQAERDIRLFEGRTKQYIFISSASAYVKPLPYYRITESTPLANPFWDYSRDKIDCEELLMHAFRQRQFPVTIVRPSHTYDDGKVPLCIQGSKGPWQVVDNIRRGKPVIVIGDGSSLWTVTHSSDFAKAFVGLMGNRAAVGESVQITSDEVLAWDEIYDCIGAALGAPVRKVHVSSDFLTGCDPSLGGGLLGDKACSVVFDNSKVKRLVPDYVANVRFSDGIRRSIGYLLAHPELQQPDEEFDRFCNRVMAARDEALKWFRGGC